MLLGTLGTSLFGDLLIAKGKIRAGEGRSGLLMPSHLLTNFERQKYYQNEPKFNDVYLRNNLPKIKDEAYVINLDQYESIGTHLMALYVNGNNRRG